MKYRIDILILESKCILGYAPRSNLNTADESNRQLYELCHTIIAG